MLREIFVNPSNLQVINLHGITPDKLREARSYFDKSKQGYGFRPINLRINHVSGGILALDGTHRAVVLAENGIERVAANLWEFPDMLFCDEFKVLSSHEIPDPLVRINFIRAYQFHSAACLLGYGNVGDLLALASRVD